MTGTGSLSAVTPYYLPVSERPTPRMSGAGWLAAGLDTTEEPDREEPAQQGDNTDIVEVFTVEEEEDEEEEEEEKDLQAVKKVVWEDFTSASDKEQAVSKDCDDVTAFCDDKGEGEPDIVIEAFDYDPDTDDAVPVPRKLTGLAGERPGDRVEKEENKTEEMLLLEEGERKKLLRQRRSKEKTGQCRERKIGELEEETVIYKNGGGRVKEAKDQKKKEWLESDIE